VNAELCGNGRPGNNTLENKGLTLGNEGAGRRNNPYKKDGNDSQMCHEKHSSKGLLDGDNIRDWGTGGGTMPEKIRYLSSAVDGLYGNPCKPKISLGGQRMSVRRLYIEREAEKRGVVSQPKGGIKRGVCRESRKKASNIDGSGDG